MSGELKRSEAIQIPTNRYGYSIPEKTPYKYLFELNLNLKNSYKTVKKVEDARYVSLISLEDNINYDDIENYSINVSIIPDDNGRSFSSSGSIRNYMSFFSNQDNNIYIEFNKLNNGHATCTCRYVDYDNFNLSISPPF